MYTNMAPTRQVATETITFKPTFIPWRAAGTLALQKLEQQITRRFARVVTEVVDETVYHHNFDLPYKRHLVDQGFNVPENTHLEPAWLDRQGRTQLSSQMDGTDFRERCVVRGKTLSALHLKAPSQLQPKTWLRAEYVAEKTGIPYDLAYQVVAAFKTLSITSWPVAKRLLAGVVATGKIWTPHGTLQTGLAGKVLKPGIARSKDPIAAAKILIDLAAQLEMYSEHMTYGFDVTTGYDEPDQDDMADDDTPDPLEEPPVDDLIDAPGTDNAFSTHALADGTDALPYSFEWQIRNATAKELREFSSGMFTATKRGGSDPEFEFTDDQRAYLRRNRYVTDYEIDLAETYIQDPKRLPPGATLNKDLLKSILIEDPEQGQVWTKAVFVPKRYWFFSVAQIKHFWAIYNVRKAELAEEARQDPNFQRIKVFVATASRRDAAAAIYAYRDGRAFDLWGIEQIIDGEQTPSKETLDELWGDFKKYHQK